MIQGFQKQPDACFTILACRWTNLLPLPVLITTMKIEIAGILLASWGKYV